MKLNVNFQDFSITKKISFTKYDHFQAEYAQKYSEVIRKHYLTKVWASNDLIWATFVLDLPYKRSI